MGQGKKQLRFGFTTGACAAAAAKAAALLLFSGKISAQRPDKISSVDIPFPDGTRVRFSVQNSVAEWAGGTGISTASVIKDAGDDPDVTHGAEIRASVRRLESEAHGRDDISVEIKGGEGVGIVTKPGLPVAVGAPAINPVPRRMITQAVQEAVRECRADVDPDNGGILPHYAEAALIEVTISVPNGEEMAKKTLNARLGILGGISILGTTGIVRPLSDEAWTATIDSSMSVAKALARDEVVLSTGRTSERAFQQIYNLPDECLVMMGDYTEYALSAARAYGFRLIHLSCQWAKMIKIAMGASQTHVRHGALEAAAAKDFLCGLGIDAERAEAYNTTREIYDYISASFDDPKAVFRMVCRSARAQCEKITRDIPVRVHLVSYEGVVIAESG